MSGSEGGENDSDGQDKSEVRSDGEREVVWSISEPTGDWVGQQCVEEACE